MKTQIAMLITFALVWNVSVLDISAMQKPTIQTLPEISGLTASIVDEVRHQLVMMPYYGVFDWLEGEVQPNGTVTLRGQVTRPTTKVDAEARVRKVEGVSKVVSEIEVLPISPTDDAIRIAMYRALFNYDKPLFRYAVRAVPPIHIIVNNGRVTLKGFVANDMDKQLAETYAKGVSGVFEVRNELKVDKDNY
jgi:hyperosmotically inducible periplasmic protein